MTLAIARLQARSVTVVVAVALLLGAGPLTAATGRVMPGLPAADQEVPLEAETTGVQLSWFVDGEFLGTFAAQERVWWTPREGAHEIVVVDEAGLSSRRALEVRAR